MFKKFTKLMLVGTLVLSFATPLLVTEADAGWPYIPWYGFPYGSITFEALLKRLGNVENNETELRLAMTSITAEVSCLNPNLKSKRASTSSEAMFPDEVVGLNIPIMPDVVHNGTATIIEPIDDDDLSGVTTALWNLYQDGKLCPNKWWTLQYTTPFSEDDYDIVGFYVRIELFELGVSMHAIEASCSLDLEAAEYLCDETCNSQEGQPCPPFVW